MIRLAITGAGYISKIHAAAALTLSDVNLTAVVDRYPATAQSFAKDYNLKRYYENIDQLLSDGGIDALVVGTPNYLHLPQTIAALNAGIHVMVEKPMAMNAQEAYLMLKASQKSGALIMVAHCWRFDPEVLWLRRQSEAGRLGIIIRTKGYGVHPLWGPSGWFTQKKLAGGGAMADMGIHAIDTVRFLLGDPRPESVYAHIGTYYTKYDVDDTGILIINWEGGITSYIESGWWQPHTDGPLAATQLYGTGGFGQIYPTFLLDQSGQDDPGFPHPRINHAPQSLYNDQMRYFIQCIHEQHTPIPGGLEGWINMKIVDAAYKSSETGKVIKVK
jgi:predicted dehydrogenase